MSAFLRKTKLQNLSFTLNDLRYITYCRWMVVMPAGWLSVGGELGRGVALLGM